MPYDENDVQIRLADIFRAKARHLEDQRLREDAAEKARRAHATVFREIVTQCALPVFEAVGEELAGYGLEHRIKLAGLLEGDRYDDRQHATFEFRFVEEAGATGPLLGRAFLRFATDMDAMGFELHTEIVGGPDTPFVASASNTRSAELNELDRAFFQAAVLDLVERAVESTYGDPGATEDVASGDAASAGDASGDDGAGAGDASDQASASAKASTIGT